MTITIHQNVAYPIASMPVTFTATGAASGNRVRFRVASVPKMSAIKEYDEASPEWIADGVFTADVEGKYVLEGVEENFNGYIPGFSNDAGPSPGTLSNMGPTDSWVEADVVEHTVYVGCKMTKTLGVSPDQITMTLHCVGTASEDGALTSFYDDELCPKLDSPTSERAEIAMGATEVVESLRRIGGAGYTRQDNVILTSGLTATSALQSPYYNVTYYGLAYWLKVAFDNHRGITTNGAHGTADATNTISSPNATNLTSCCTLLNELKTDYTAHLALGATVHPGGADVNHLLSAANATTLATAIALANDISTQYEAHRKDPIVHDPPGDGVYTSRIYQEQCWDLPSCILLANDIKAKYTAHLARVDIATAYHALEDTHNLTSTLPEAVDGASLIIVANGIADLITAHVTNINSTDDSEALYHDVADTGSSLAQVPRAGTEAEAVTLLEAAAYFFTRHVDTQGPWHGLTDTPITGCTANPGNGLVPLWGVTKLNYEFTKATRAADLGGGPNMLVAQQQLITLGGFAKA